MKHFYTLTIVLALSVQHSLAQIVNLNWATSILHGWSNGATSGSANNIGGSSVNATISINNTQTASYGDFGIRLYPNPATNSATITINSENKLAAHIKLYNQFGLLLQHLQRPLIAGSNNIPVPGINTLPAGNYIITVEDETGKKMGTTQFLKQ